MSGWCFKRRQMLRWTFVTRYDRDAIWCTQTKSHVRKYPFRCIPRCIEEVFLESSLSLFWLLDTGPLPSASEIGEEREFLAQNISTFPLSKHFSEKSAEANSQHPLNIVCVAASVFWIRLIYHRTEICLF